MAIQKGAMFGLDARIALIILGSLSIISSAALFSVISSLQVSRTANALREVNKALESYLFDVQYDLVQISSTSNALYTERRGLDLIESSESGWQGPYIEGAEEAASDNFIYISESPQIGAHIYWMQDGDWGGEDFSETNVLCATGIRCMYFIKSGIADIDETKRLAYAEKLDNYLDQGDGPDVGDFRYSWLSSDESHVRIYYRMMPTLYKYD